MTVSVVVVMTSHGGGRLDERTAMRTVHLCEGVNVLQLRAAEVPVDSAAIVRVEPAATTVTSATAAARVGVLGERGVLTGELGLDALAVRGVADGREDGANALDELKNVVSDKGTSKHSRVRDRASSTHHHTLADLAVVQDGLDDIVAVAVAKELLESGAVEHLSDEDLPDLGVGHADALLHDVGREP
jgi:hypothetical protein